MSSAIAGLDVSDGQVAAVLVDTDGRVTRRASAHGSDALPKAVKQLGAAAASARIGVALDRSSDPLAARTFGSRSAHVYSPGEAAIAAETWIGAARGADDAVCLWIGARVFAGLMLDGKPRAGAHGLAGSVAWLALNPVERQDYRRFGSLAAEVSSTGIARRLAWRIQSGDASDVQQRAGRIDAITAAHVFDGARRGDGVSLSVMRETAKYVAMAITNLAAVLDPEVIVLAGELAEARDLLLEPIAHECERQLSPALLSQFRLEFSPLGADGVAIGAARLASLA